MRTSEHVNPRDGTFRLTRRNMLFLAGGTAATGLLFASGVAQADARPLGAERISAAVTAVLAASAPAAAQVAPLARFQQAAQTTFVPINSGLTFGQPTDVAAGWDGTLWAVDEQGAPHVYDPLSNTWQLHGTGVDAAALINDAGPAVYFKGGEVYVADGNSVAQPIASLWPQLPPSYKLGVQGAAWAQPIGKLMLFRGGTYLTVPWPAPGSSGGTPVYHAPLQAAATSTATPKPAPSAKPSVALNPAASPSAKPTTSGTLPATPTSHAPAATATAQPAANVTHAVTPDRVALKAANAAADYVPVPLTSLIGWSSNNDPAWQAGVIDGVVSLGLGEAALIRGGEFRTLITSSGTNSVSAPAPLSEGYFQNVSLPAEWLASGVDAGFYVDNASTFYVFRGPQVATNTNGAGWSYNYIRGAATPWPPTWHPGFQHAPNGRNSGLWAASVEGYPMSFDGTRWTQQPGDASSIGVGQDGSVFSVGQQNQQQLSQWSGSGWNPVASHPSPLAQVSVGNAGQVWTRDSNNAVHQLNQGQLQPVTQVGVATHLAANADGSLFSCNGSDSNAYRYASDLSVGPAAISAPGTVQKVASTRFGAAHCLTAQNGTAQVYQVQSPYVFRSANSYTTTFGDSIEAGLGNLYITSEIIGSDLQPTVYFVVAVDGQTGQELSRTFPAQPGWQFTPPVFDALHETVIVGMWPDPDSSLQTGVLLGFDARDLTQMRWSITLPNNPATGQPFALGSGRPTLSGTRLCVTDNFNTLIMYDTGQAPGATPSSTPVWTYTFPSSPNDDHRLPPPVIANGRVYAAWWLFSRPYGFLQLWLWNLDATTGVGTQTNVESPPGWRYVGDPRSNGSEWDWMGHMPPLLAAVPGAEAGQPRRQVLFVNSGGSVAGVDINANSVQYYDLPGSGSYVSSGFGFANGVLWFGDDGSNLHGVQGQTMQPLATTPAALGSESDTSILTTPVPYSYGQGLLAVLLGVFDEGASVPGLLAFDPTTGNVASIPTQGTTFIALSRTVSNGNIYAGGAAATGSSGTRAQVYSLRVDAALQGLRDFVVDSQLLQDFDDPSQPTHNPNGVARYQTHLTLIDDQKAPIADHTLKLWSDQANTNIIANGKIFTIGPDDDQYAAVTTDSSGVVTIVSGYTQPDASDKPDMSAPPLRAWASFMDPYERMMVFRDREFHNRVASAHATDAGQSGADDPTRPNLKTAQKYGPIQKGGANSGGQLFTAQQQSDGQPQQVATTIQKMSASVGTAPPAGSKTLKASFAQLRTDAPGKYLAYADTPGAQYSPVNVAANRAAVVLQTAGFSFSSNNDASISPAYSSMSPAEAMQAIDALEGQPWHTSQYATPRVKAAAAAGTLHLGGFFEDFWNWLKGAAATITHIIVSVADDIYAGIRFLINGVEHVFQTIVAGIEQIASIIGAFFVELGHLIEEIIEALSVLFQFGHIIDTHNMLKAELLNRINGIPGNPEYPGFSKLVTGSVLPPVNDFFNTAEETITNALNQMANALGTNSPAAFPGGGSTVHSAMVATPSAGGASSSTATQGTWGMQKFNAGVGSGGGMTAMLSRKFSAGTGDPIADFFSNFANAIASDATLQSQWLKIQNGAQALDNTSSASDFIKQGLAELLNILALLIDGVLAIGKASVAGLLGIVDDIIQTSFDPQTGLLNTPVDIPVLSWLYQLLFGEPLTILNAVMLITAIPLTIIWRIIEGRWPSESPFSATRVMRLGAAPAETQRQLALWNMLTSIILGILYGVGDAAGDGDVPLIIGRAALLLSLTSAAITTPSISSVSPGPLAWSAWGLTLAMALLNVLGSHDLSDITAEYESVGRLGPALLMGFSGAQLLVLGLEWDPAYGVAPTNPYADAALGISMATTLPGLVNGAKMGNEVAALVIAALDVVMGVAAGAAGVISAFSST